MILLPPLASSSRRSIGEFMRNRLFLVLGLIVAAILLITVGVFIGSRTNSVRLADDSSQRIPSREIVRVNKTFSFPVADTQGQQVTTISYTITSVDKQQEIIIKGQKAQAVGGRTFFIISITLTNTSHQTIQLSTRDYIRISVKGNSELLASDIHNDPVVVQPISTEHTQIGFPIDANTMHLILHVGELNGKKTDIPITFTH